MVPFLFNFFRTLLKLVVPFSKPLSASVPFGVKIQNGAKFLGGFTPLNPLGEYKKSAIGVLILRGFRRVAPYL